MSTWNGGTVPRSTPIPLFHTLIQKKYQNSDCSILLKLVESGKQAGMPPMKYLYHHLYRR